MSLQAQVDSMRASARQRAERDRAIEAERAAEKRIRDAERAEENRRTMPTVTAFVDEMKAAFGADQVRVTYASENGRAMGRKSTEVGLPLSQIYLTPSASSQKATAASKSRRKDGL